MEYYTYFMTIGNMLFLFSYVTDPSITQITKLIEGEPEFKIVREGETITKVIHGGWYVFSHSICISIHYSPTVYTLFR